MLLGLRTPLSRVALAANELSRDFTTPAQQWRAAQISQLIRHLDARIDQILPLLSEPTCPEPESAQLAAVLDQLRERLAAALEARGVEWLPAHPTEPPIRGGAHRARRCAVMLLRAGAAWTGPGGRVRLSPVRGSRGGGLSLECLCDASAPSTARPDFPIGRLSELAAYEGGLLEHHELPAGVRITLWLPGVA